MAMTVIGVVTSIPADAPGTGAAADSLETNGNNGLEILLKASAGSGDVVLLRWFGELTEWRPWKPDRPLQPDAADLARRYASGVYIVPAHTKAHWLLWDTSGGSLSLDTAYANMAEYRAVY